MVGVWGGPSGRRGARFPVVLLLSPHCPLGRRAWSALDSRQRASDGRLGSAGRAPARSGQEQPEGAPCAPWPGGAGLPSSLLTELPPASLCPCAPSAGESQELSALRQRKAKPFLAPIQASAVCSGPSARRRPGNAVLMDGNVYARATASPCCDSYRLRAGGPSRSPKGSPLRQSLRSTLTDGHSASVWPPSVARS